MLPVELAVRMRFNPNLEQERFGAVMAIINNITMLAIVLTGSALIREREHGTIEHQVPNSSYSGILRFSSHSYSRSR